MSIIEIFPTCYICRLDGDTTVVNAYTPISFGGRHVTP